jgi:hypothetical protein
LDAGILGIEPSCAKTIRSPSPTATETFVPSTKRSMARVQGASIRSVTTAGVGGAVGEPGSEAEEAEDRSTGVRGLSAEQPAAKSETRRATTAVRRMRVSTIDIR